MRDLNPALNLETIQHISMPVLLRVTAADCTAGWLAGVRNTPSGVCGGRAVLIPGRGSVGGMWGPGVGVSSACCCSLAAFRESGAVVKVSVEST